MGQDNESIVMTAEIRNVLIGLTPEAISVVDAISTAEGVRYSRGATIELLLWGNPVVSRQAKALGIIQPTRGADGRGKHWKEKR